MINIIRSESIPSFNHSQHQQKEDARGTFQMSTILTISAYLPAYLVSVSITINIIILVCLFCRLIRVKFGSKIRPDGGKAILITGATSGIGLVISKYFFKLGFTVICGYYNNQEPGYAELLELSIESSSSTIQSTTVSINEDDQQKKNKSEKKQCNEQYAARMFLIEMDVRSEKSIEKSSKEIDSILDQYNIELFSLINNAGIAADTPFQWQARESIRNMIETNLMGVMMVTRQFIDRIIKAKGRVVNVSSGLYLYPARTIAIYGSTKSAIVYYSSSLDADLAKSGARCRCVAPGNHIINSDIMFAPYGLAQQAISKLTPEERELHKESIDEFMEGRENLLRKKFARDDNLDPVKISSLHRLRLPDDIMSGQLKSINSKKTLLDRIISWFVNKLDGSAENLEKSGLVEGFDNAVRLRDCPRILYAGHKFYNHISGPFTEYLPRILCNQIAGLVLMGTLDLKQ